MDLGLAQGAFSNEGKGYANGIYNGVNAGSANGVYNENIVNNGIVRSGLVMYLDAGQYQSYPKSGNNFFDISYSGSTGTLTNNPTFENAYGGSLKFNGTNNYVQLNNNTAMDLTGAFTLSCWFKYNDDTNLNMLLSRERTSPSNPYTFWHLSAFKFPRLLLQNGAASFDSTSTNALTKGFIYNLTTVLTSVDCRHYVNGKLDSTFVNTFALLPNYTSAYNWVLGASQNTFISYGNQNQYLTMMYNRALSAGEVLQNYQATKSRFGL